MNIGMHFGGIRSTLVEFERILVKIKSIPDFCQFVVKGKKAKQTFMKFRGFNS